MIMHREFPDSPHKLQLNIDLHCLLLQATFREHIQISSEEKQWSPCRTARRSSTEQWHDSPVWSPKANSEAGSRTPSL